MSPWVLRGLRNGIVTTRWPDRPDPYADGWRGPATVVAPAVVVPAVVVPAVVVPAVVVPAVVARADDADGLDALCPTGAISVQPAGAGPPRIHLDQGRCILCGRCVDARPSVFGWSHGPGAAALTRGSLVVPEIPDTSENLNRIRNGLRLRTAALRRSVHLRHVDAGSDGGEEQEIAALLGPVYDVHRLGVFFTASPRHADVLLVTGAGARGMIGPLRRTYDGMPDPKLVIAVGTDAVSGGLVSPSYATTGGLGEAVGVDAWLPGSPPSPFAILHALLLVLGALPAREEARR